MELFGKRGLEGGIGAELNAPGKMKRCPSFFRCVCRPPSRSIGTLFLAVLFFVGAFAEWLDAAEPPFGGEALELEVLELIGCADSRGCRPHSGVLIDLDGDGDLDLVGIATHPAEFIIIDNVDGIMVPRSETYRFGTFGRANGEHGQWVEVGDLDGDGDADLVSVDNETHDFWVHINAGDGNLEPVTEDRRIGVRRGPQHVALGDLDGDGDLDAVTSNFADASISIVVGNGDGTFQPQSIRIRTGESPRSSVIGDFNGDALGDIVVANAEGRSLTVLLNPGGGNFPTKGVTLMLAGIPLGVAAGDFDDDGDLDIVAAIGDLESCAVLLNDGDGTFADPEYFDVNEAVVYSVTVVDINMDGLLDLLTANEGAGSVSILHGNGNGTFGAPINFSAGPNAGLRVTLPGDLDGDGDLDIATFNRGNGTASILRNQLDPPMVLDYAESIDTIAEFLTLSAEVSVGASAGQRFVKFTIPTNEGAALRSTVYQNSTRFPLHREFLANTFPESFPALDAATYDTLVGRRASRQYFVGTIRVIETAAEPVYGFDVFARFGDAEERLRLAEIEAIYEQLGESFRLEPFLFAPTSSDAVEIARVWQQQDPGFPIFIEGSTGGFEPYTFGVGYGRVRILSSAEFERANERGEISFQDILVLDRAPRDIEGVVNGVISSERQGPLSHVAVRTAQRGTPNAFLRTALDDFSELDGQLVRLQVTESGYSVSEVSEEQAVAFWEANAGFLSRLPSLDSTFEGLPSLEMIVDMEIAGGGGFPVEARFGGKAVNLARLRSILTGRWSGYRMNGFAVPMAHYLRFIRSNRMPSALVADREVTYEEYLLELFASEEFATNSQFRFYTLADLREHMREFGQVDESLLTELRDRIATVMGTPSEVRVRFRSSSNVEDAIEFNGAGLYDSTQGCVADDLDGDSIGPSICNETKGGERGLLRALRRVWSSLWNFRAYEERAFYRIPDELAAMGILVNEAFADELANGVATTGNPTRRNDRRFVITVQKDDRSVVSPDPGILPEKNILEIDESGEVFNIIRAVASTLVEPGEFVLSDAELNELGALMAHIDGAMAVDPGEHSRDDIIFEIEFKKRADGRLAVKQVRPFLLAERGPAAPTFALEIPDGTVLCATFSASSFSRTVADEFNLKAQLHLIGGVTELPTVIEQFSGNLVERFVVGPDRRVATPVGAGTFSFEKLVAGEEGRLIYRFDYEQQLAFSDGGMVEVTLSILEFQTMDGVIVDRTLSFDSVYLVDGLSLRTRFSHQGEIVSNFYGSCDLEGVPLWEIRMELDNGMKILLDERYRNEAFGDFQPAALVGAVIEIDGESRRATDYWGLIYKATRHNEHVEHMVIFDTPMAIPGLGTPVFGIHLIGPTPTDGIVPVAIYVDENLDEIARIGVRTYSRREVVRNSLDKLGLRVNGAIVAIDVDGTTDEYLTVSFRRSVDPDVGTYRVEGSTDLSNWNADVVRVSLGDEGDGVVTETWRSTSPFQSKTLYFLRVVFGE